MRSAAWLKKDKGQLGNERPLWDVLTDMLSAKVATVEDMHLHCDYLLTYLPRILDHNMKRRVRRFAFHGHIRRTAALDDLCHRMTGGKGMEAVVVFGACRALGTSQDPSCSCGNGWSSIHVSSSSMSTTRRIGAARATLRQQKRTHHSLKLLPGRARHVPGKRVGTFKKRDIRGVRWCSQCETTWNRDCRAGCYEQYAELEQEMKSLPKHHILPYDRYNYSLRHVYVRVLLL